MRLGGYVVAQSVEDLDPLCEKLDHSGLSASPAPTALAEMTVQACLIFGEWARALNIMVGEAAYE